MAQPSAAPQGSAQAQTTKQDQLAGYCQREGVHVPTYQILSDRRGGRTAWSCQVSVGGHTLAARYWYDGQYINNAKEDAAERALQYLGQIPAPPGPHPSHYQYQQRGPQGPGAGSGGS